MRFERALNQRQHVLSCAALGAVWRALLNGCAAEALGGQCSSQIRMLWACTV